MQPQPALGLHVQAYSGKGVLACDIKPPVSAAASATRINAFQTVIRACLLVVLAAGLHVPA